MKFKIIVIILFALPFVVSCSDDDVIDVNGGSNNENIVEEIPVKLYIDWSASLSIVQDSTKGLKLMNSETDFLHYYSEKLDQTVSYEFTENLLSAVAIVLPMSDSINNLTAQLLTGLDYVGEKDSASVYISQSQNMFAVKYQTTDLTDSIRGTYVVVGFTPLAE